MKRPEGIIVIAIYYALMALIFLVGACALLFALVTVVMAAGDPMGSMWGGFGVGVGLLFVLLFLVGSALAAWGLLAMAGAGPGHRPAPRLPDLHYHRRPDHLLPAAPGSEIGLQRRHAAHAGAGRPAGRWPVRHRPYLHGSGGAR